LFGIVFGLGSLHAILHALVFTVGLGVARSITGIAIVEAALWIWPSAHRPDATPADGGGQNLGQANPRPAPAFSFLATPHLYPVGTSVRAAWLNQAADGPLLVDLATLPGFLLLVAACTGLRHRLGGRPGPLGIVLVADALVAHRRHRTLNGETTLKILLWMFCAIAFGIHAAMLVGSPWTSLEWTKGSSIRYLLPFLVLWPLLWFSSIFTESRPWHRLRPWGAVVGAAMAGSALWLYVTHQAMPGLSADAWYPIIDTRALLVAGGVAGLGLMGSYPRFRRLGVSVLAIGMTALVVLFARSAAMVQAGATARDAPRRRRPTDTRRRHEIPRLRGTVTIIISPPRRDRHEQQASDSAEPARTRSRRSAGCTSREGRINGRDRT
jgi:hypothetical protein